MENTQTFSYNDMVGTVKRANSRLDAFDAAVYSRKLYGLYAVDVSSFLDALKYDAETEKVEYEAKILIRPEVQAGLTIVNEIQRFCNDIAPRVAQFIGGGLDHWPTSRESAEAIDAAFRLWLSDNYFQIALDDITKYLDNPNGVAAGIVTEAEAKDPLSKSSVPILERD